MRVTLEMVLASRDLQRLLGVKPSPDGTTLEIDWRRWWR